MQDARVPQLRDRLGLPFAADVRYDRALADAVAKYQKANGINVTGQLTTATIGLAGLPRLVPHEEWSTLALGLAKATLVEAEDLLDRQRAIKSAREIAQVRRASHIVDRALASVPEHPATGDESRLAALVMREARRRGAEDIRLSMARTGEPDWAFRPAGEASTLRNDGGSPRAGTIAVRTRGGPRDGRRSGPALLER